MARLGWLAWVLRSKDRRTADRQLTLAFPWLSPIQRNALLRQSFLDCGRNLADAVRDDAEVEIDPEDLRMLAQYREGSRPTLFLAAHLGCWEQLGRFLARGMGELGVITANPHNSRIDEWLRQERRRRGMVPFDRRLEGRAAARWLESGRPLVILGDLRASASAVEASWFGVPAPTARGPARLAQRSGAALLPVGICRDGPVHRVLVGREVPCGPSEPAAAVALRCNEALEALIRRAPAEWAWFHDRYDGPPEGPEGDLRV
jgi:KDO2-lipid IV(A) lauroyltransferase